LSGVVFFAARSADPSAFVQKLGQGVLVVILELGRLEVPALLLDDVSRQIEHVLGDFHILDLVKIFRRSRTS
jgi:hypothetical protein